MRLIARASIKKGGLAPPFLFLAAAGAAAGSVDASPALWAVALALLAGAAWCLQDSPAPGLTAISVAVWTYALWVVATNAVASPVYTAAAPFHAAFLAGGFALGRRLDTEARDRAYVWLAAGAAGLGLWALWQLAAGTASRGHANFETPNTLAAVLNLVLVPMLAMFAWNSRRANLAIACVVLAAGLAATFSRGGFLALACGLLAAAVLARRLGVPIERRGAAGAAAALALGWSIAELTPFIAQLTPVITQWLPVAPGQPGAPEVHAIFGGPAKESSGSRLELYALAASGLEGRLALGMGYLGFNALLEAGRLAVPSYGADGVTYFAHNDYLQTLVELGLPGLVALLAMVLLPFSIALHRGSRDVRDPRALAVALAAIATMTVHAAVDFPFYVPVCLLLFGFALGTADRMLAPEDAIRNRWHLRPVRLTGIAVAAFTAMLLVPPVAAQAAAGYAQRRWLAADGQAAAYWFEVARRIERRDWRYHWYAGQFWLAQAALNAHPVAVRQADDAFAAGFAANPREPRNLIGRIATHRRFGALLAAPAGPEKLRGWTDQALALAPLNAQVRSEQSAVLDHLRRLAGGAAK